jgi:hypothetical protein
VIGLATVIRSRRQNGKLSNRRSLKDISTAIWAVPLPANVCSRLDSLVMFEQYGRPEPMRWLIALVANIQPDGDSCRVTLSHPPLVVYDPRIPHVDALREE